jgi:hypothetical protein
LTRRYRGLSANVANGHHLVNESDADCSYVAISAGPDGGGVYPDIDMVWDDQGNYRHKDGTPIQLSAPNNRRRTACLKTGATSGSDGGQNRVAVELTAAGSPRLSKGRQTAHSGRIWTAARL